jgi:D-psicose/D-tagatose/L-ribulose 3-epimerase
MKFGMNMLLWTTHVTEDDHPHLEKIKAAGFDGAEIPIFEGDAAHYKKLGETLKNLGLGSTAVTVSGEDTSPISPDAGIRQAAVDDLKTKIDHCALIGAEALCGPYHQALGVFSGEGPTEDEKKRATDVHRTVADHAQQAGVKLAIEYLNRFECYFLTTAEEAVEHVKRVNHPFFGTMYDTFHANIEEKDPIAAFRDNAEHFVHFHVSENDRGTPGKGHVPWLETFKAVRQSSYDGWMTIEAFGRALPDLAAATRVWRDFFPTREEVYEEGIRFMKEGWAKAAP